MKLLNWLKSAFVFFALVVFVSGIMFYIILGAMQMRKERVRLDYIHQYRIDKTMQNLEGRENLP